uniref:RRM domain-containing protein n=1 Tax=Noctiluca scintillans TaxID=2966 RepID=A0A7S1A426_NOCSC|mmetsp:Transcript_29873/g.79490  ORF Transcript_29873/g.79490 Transcript_29873/m.79490 type:complete len:494 (+) Transcript_29873:128-1609(+)
MSDEMTDTVGAAGQESPPAGDSRESGSWSLDEVQERLEKIFDRQSLSEDAYVQKHMNAQFYIPISVLEGHEQLSNLGIDSAMLVAAVRRSEKVLFDEDNAMVRPVLKAKRNTLILHDLPEGTTEDDIRQLFSNSPEMDTVQTVKPDVNQTAFVTFETDEAAQNAALWLRSQKLSGSTIKCAVKSEQFLRSFFPAPQTPVSPFVPNMMWSGCWMSPGQGWASQQVDCGSEMYTDETWGDWNLDAACGASKGKGRAKGKGRGWRKGGEMTPSEQTLSAKPSPSIPTREETYSQGNEDDGTIMVPLGYAHMYRKYSRQHIMQVCEGMTTVTKPESYERLEQEENGSLFRQSPCKDWAPMPTPLFSFAPSSSPSPNFDERKGGDEDFTREGSVSAGRGWKDSEWEAWGNDAAKWKKKAWTERWVSPGQHWVEKGQGERHPAWAWKGPWESQTRGDKWVAKTVEQSGKEKNVDTNVSPEHGPDEYGQLNGDGREVGDP